MNDEIKEILDYLKTKNGTIGSELSYEETQLLLDYIANLQEENEIVHKDFAELSDRYFFTKSRINKAIEYIEKNTEYLDIEKGEVFECEGYRSNRVPIISVSGLLNILKGEDNE